MTTQYDGYDKDMIDNLFVTGALVPMLTQWPAIKSVHLGPDDAPNTLIIELHFMASSYRLTVERIADDETPRRDPTE